MATVDPTLPGNRAVLDYLGRGGGSLDDDPHPDEADRYHLGCHPDLVARLWDELAGAFDGDARAVVLATPAIVDPGSGLLMAVCLGTTYALRMTPDDAAAAVADGGSTVHEYRSVGRILDLGATFGVGWVFGCHSDDEAACLRRSAAAQSDPA